MKKIKVYLADDHQLIIDGIKGLLTDNENIVFCGSSNDGTQAEQDILSLRPDIALLDIRMPGKDGLKLTQSLHQKGVSCKIIILSMYDEARYINDAKNYGAWGYLLKNTGKAEFIEAIEKVYAGTKTFHKPLSKDAQPDLFLTPREKDVVRILLAGKMNQQIADELNLGIQTIMTHRKNIREKTGASNTAQLIKILEEKGLFF